MNTKTHRVGDLYLHMSARPYDYAPSPRTVDQQTISQTIAQIAREYGEVDRTGNYKDTHSSRKDSAIPKISLSPAVIDALCPENSVPMPELSKISYSPHKSTASNLALSPADMNALYPGESVPVSGLPSVLQTTALRNRSGTSVLTHTLEGKVNVSSDTEYEHAVESVMKSIPPVFWKCRSETHDPYVLKLRMRGETSGGYTRGTFHARKDHPKISIDADGLLTYNDRGVAAETTVRAALMHAYAEVKDFVRDEVHRPALAELPKLRRAENHRGQFRSTLA